MIATEITVNTPTGSFLAQWDDDPDVPVQYAGDQHGVAYFRHYMDVARVTGHGGLRLDPDQLEPADLVGFCNSAKYGITVMPDADYVLAVAEQLAREMEQERKTLVDVIAQAVKELEAATSPIDKIRKAGVLATLLVQLRELDGTAVA